ncbi:MULTISPECIES: hypothetical protein [unclassified Wolbachia]|nr:hypothetical protein [Wolbachia endosymbiont (group A) of Apoderus coryli]
MHPYGVIQVADTGSLMKVSFQCSFFCHPSAQTLGSSFYATSSKTFI